MYKSIIYRRLDIPLIDHVDNEYKANEVNDKGIASCNELVRNDHYQFP